MRIGDEKAFLAPSRVIDIPTIFLQIFASLFGTWNEGRVKNLTNK